MNQIEWEQHCRKQKIDKKLYELEQQKRRGYVSESALGQTIINQFLIYVADELQDMVNRKPRGMGGKYITAVVDASKFLNRKNELEEDWKRVAYIGMVVTLDRLFKEPTGKVKLVYVASSIAQALENEQQMNYFKASDEGIAFLHENDVAEYKGSRVKRIQRVKKALAEQDRKWVPWGNRLRIHVGTRILSCITRVMDGYLHSKELKLTTRKELYLIAKPELYEFIGEHTQYLLGKLKNTQPCIEQPIDWERHEDGDITGGFHSLECSSTVPFVRTKTKAQREHILVHNPSLHINACNHLQSTEFTVNQDVYDLLRTAIEIDMFPGVIPTLVQKEFGQKPEDDDPKRKEWGHQAHEIYKWNRKNTTNLLRIQNVLTLSKFFTDRSMWFVYNTDFRGRIYACSSYLNPQGTEYIRGLLKFKKGKPLGKPGYKWLAVHGANCYGLNKISYSDRFDWVMDNLEGIQAVASCPTSSEGRKYLNGAAKPFQFYAFCREWAELSKSKTPSTYVSHLPVSLDGSCNGFQHYSALLCDGDGASRVNLTSTDVPQDFYNDVAVKLREVLTSDNAHPVGESVLNRIDRSFVKPVVMTYPYGITIRGASMAIKEQLDNDWNLIQHVVKHLLAVIEDLAKSSKELQLWFKEASECLGRVDRPTSWSSPVGFPVMQPYTLYKEHLIKTEFFGRKALHYPDEPIGVMRSKAKVSLAPNFIHSMDASHLVMVINEAKAKGITDLLCIHDDIGTYAADTHQLRNIINEQFFELYSRNRLYELTTQWQEHTQLPSLPAQGDYDIAEIFGAQYFFG